MNSIINREYFYTINAEGNSERVCFDKLLLVTIGVINRERHEGTIDASNEHEEGGFGFGFGLAAVFTVHWDFMRCTLFFTVKWHSKQVLFDDDL
jgi:hypothetical protein